MKECLLKICPKRDERSWGTTALLSLCCEEERERRTEGEKRRQRGHIEAMMHTFCWALCVSQTHSTRVRCCDSPWPTKHTEVKGQSGVDVWWKDLMSLPTFTFTSSSFTFSLPLPLFLSCVSRFSRVLLFCPPCPVPLSLRTFPSITSLARMCDNISFTNRVSCFHFVRGMQPKRKSSSVSAPIQTAEPDEQTHKNVQANEALRLKAALRI